MSEVFASRPQPVPAALPPLLSFAAGFIDSFTVLALFGMFVAQVTGSNLSALSGRFCSLLLVTAIADYPDIMASFGFPLFPVVSGATPGACLPDDYQEGSAYRWRSGSSPRHS
jgi:hypothetical protein